MKDLDLAEKLLLEGPATFVAVKNGSEIYGSVKKGVAPVLDAVEKGVVFEGVSVADRFVGKAVALLLAGEGAVAVFAETVSYPAKEFLLKRNITLKWKKEVPFIRNRQGTGQCPLEAAVRGVADPAEGRRKILARIEELRGEENG